MVYLTPPPASRTKEPFMTFWQSFFLILEAFFFLAYLVVLFHVIGDLFRDRKLGGFAKAVWIFFLLVIPGLTALVYLVARGRGMTERHAAAVVAAREATDAYIRDAAGTTAAQQIAQAKELLDAGAIDAQEFATLKQRALAGN